MNTSNLLILLTLIGLTSCSMFEHRDFVDEMEYQYDEPLFAANRDFMVVPGDTGRAHRSKSEILQRTPASMRTNSDMRYSQSLNRELNFLENKLNDVEYSEYMKYKDKIGNISQRIYFLRLERRERNEYLSMRGIKTRPKRRANHYRSPSYQNRVTHGVFNSLGAAPKINDVTLGMSKSDVVNNWGQPDRKDIAGNPQFENERWAYRKNGAVKYIYFEAGRVEGWTEN